MINRKINSNKVPKDNDRRRLFIYRIIRIGFLIGAVFFISMVLIPGSVWTTIIYDKTLNQPYESLQAPLTEIVELAVDDSNNLYVLTNSSDALIAYSPDGAILYSIYLNGSDNGINEMVALKDQTIAILPATGNNIFVFSNGNLQQKLNMPSGVAYLKDYYKEENIQMVGSEKVTSKDGTEYHISRNGYAVSAISPSGTEKVFAHATFWDLIFAKSPLTMIWALIFVVGLIGLSVMKNNILNPVNAKKKTSTK